MAKAHRDVAESHFTFLTALFFWIVSVFESIVKPVIQMDVLLETHHVKALVQSIRTYTLSYRTSSYTKQSLIL